MNYSVEKSVVKAVKYPIFGVILGYLVKFLEIFLGGLSVQFPQEIGQITTNPKLYLTLAVVVFIYDWLKHKAGVRIP